MRQPQVRVNVSFFSWWQLWWISCICTSWCLCTFISSSVKFSWKTCFCTDFQISASAQQFNSCLISFLSSTYDQRLTNMYQGHDFTTYALTFSCRWYLWSGKCTLDWRICPSNVKLAGYRLCFVASFFSAFYFMLNYSV